MTTIHLTTRIKALPEICFDLSRSIELHLDSTAHTKEKAVAGRTSGLCKTGDTVTWEAIHFGIRQRLTVKITSMNPPHSFEDRMLRGAFKSMKHQHHFKPIPGGIEMTDIFTFEAPFGLLGMLAEKLFLRNYMALFLKQRNNMIKAEAEKLNHP
jgi:ligand-binding SRPBCC domain-containing protein